MNQDEEKNKVGKRRWGCWRVGCLTLVSLLIAAFLLPDSISSGSPDGQFTARVTATNGWQRMLFLVEGSMKFEITDKASGKRITVDTRYLGHAWDNDSPEEVLWSPDGQKFGYILTSSEAGGSHAQSFIVYRKTFTASRTPDNQWIKNILLKRAKSGDANAGRMLRYFRD